MDNGSQQTAPSEPLDYYEPDIRETSDSSYYLQQLEALNRVIQAVNSKSEVEGILDIIIDEGFKLVGAHRGLIVLYEPDRDQLVVKKYLYSKQAKPLIDIGYSFPMSKGIVGWVFRHRKPVLVEDIAKDKKWRDIYFEVFPETRAELAVPIVGRERGLGVINVESGQPSAFRPPDLKILTMLASGAGVALNNAEFLERQMLRLEAFSKTISALGSRHSLEDTLNCVVEQAVGAVRGAVGSIKLYNERNGTLEFRAVSPADYLERFNKKPFRVNVSEGGPEDSVSARTFRNRKAQLTPDVNKEPIWRDMGWPVSSAMHIPVIAGGRPLGVIGIDSYATQAFTEEDLDVLVLLANEAAKAIEAAWHDEVLRAGREVLRKMLGFVQYETHSQRQTRILQELCRLIDDSMRPKAVSFLIRKHDEPNILVILPGCESGIERAEQLELPVGEGIAGKVVSTGKIQVSKDVRIDGRYGDRNLAKRNGLVSLLSIPIKSEQEIVGALNYYTSIPRDFSSFERLTLENLCDVGGLGLSVTAATARAWEEIVKRAPVGIILTDAHGNIQYVNDTWVEIAGGNIVGYNLFELESIKNAQLAKSFRQALRGKIVELPKGRFTTKFGKNPVLSCKCVPIFRDAGYVSNLLISCWDLTKLAEQYDAVIRQKEAIALGNLAAGMTHEAMSPLKAAQYGLEQTVRELPRLAELEDQVAGLPLSARERSRSKATLRRVRALVTHSGPPPHNPTDAEIQEVCQILKKHEIVFEDQGVRRLAAVGLARHLDTLLSLQSGKYAETLFSYLVCLAGLVGACRDAHYSMFRLEDIVVALHQHAFISLDEWLEADIHETIDGALLILRPQLSKFDITVRTSYSRYVPKIKCVPGQMAQLWRNLLQNSIDALQEMRRRRLILVTSMKRGGNVVVRIDDNGRGPPRGFDLQTLTHVLPEIDKGPPRGYGLWLVSEIVERHRGRIRITARPGKGVSVTVTLPINMSD